MITFKQFWESVEEDYRGLHQAPTSGEGSAPLWDLTQIYPDDIYSTKAVQYGICLLVLSKNIEMC